MSKVATFRGQGRQSGLVAMWRPWRPCPLSPGRMATGGDRAGRIGLNRPPVASRFSGRGYSRGTSEGSVDGRLVHLPEPRLRGDAQDPEPGGPREVGQVPEVRQPVRPGTG